MRRRQFLVAVIYSANSHKHYDITELSAASGNTHLPTLLHTPQVQESPLLRLISAFCLEA